MPRTMAAPLEMKSVLLAWVAPLPSLLSAAAEAIEGIAMPRTAIKRRAPWDRAPSALNFCVWLYTPPKRKHMPRTSNKLLKMLPSKLPCTTSTSPSLSANTDSIISTAFPKVAFSRPPITSPDAMASSSVDQPKIFARGTMAKKFEKNISAGPRFQWLPPMPGMAHSSSRLSGLQKMNLKMFWKASPVLTGCPPPALGGMHAPSFAQPDISMASPRLHFV
mmetsp:Transcript_7089/g.17590  ORF Transcript_7089/g.17590 Transcript_7089/m.17590 type:complete len:220 (+) Transcript_7089:654-1313(+)